MNLDNSLILIVLVALSAVGAVAVTDLIGAAFIFGVYSFFFALLWAWLGSVDVAFTEAVVGAGISTIFIIIAVFQTSRHGAHGHSSRWNFAVISLMTVLGLLLCYGIYDLPLVGDPSSPPNVHISPDYIKNSLADMQTPNVVTAVLADYRGFDTLIETTVIFTAGTACWLILRENK